MRDKRAYGKSDIFDHGLTQIFTDKSGTEFPALLQSLNESEAFSQPINFCNDGLPKLKDFPAAIGGSGETLPE